MTDLINDFFGRVSNNKYSASIMAHGNDHELNTKLFFDGVQSISHFLSNSHKQYWGLFCDNSWDFSVALFGLIATGKDIVLPGNWQPDTQEKIKKITDAFITSTEKETRVKSEEINSILDNKSSFSFNPIKLKTTSISIFTSGSTGEPKLITKSLGHFVKEVSDLERMWGSDVEYSGFASTVSHQHIYGLLFKVLWPLLMGRPFYTQLFQYPEELVKLSSKNRITLISSPAQLKRLPDSNQAYLLNDKFNKIFSSGGSLPIEENRKVQELVNRPITEVFGSSETGGVAFRVIDESCDLSWHCFPSVAIKETDRKQLAVKSPFITTDDFYVMADEIELRGESDFILCGRSDRIVKIEEKRLSLEAMELKLQSHVFIKSCAVTVLEGRRQTVATVVELSHKGLLELKKESKKHIVSLLKHHLLQEFERVVLPKKWRFVSNIPSDPQGKRKDIEIKSLFEKKPFLKNDPVLVNIEKEQTKAKIIVDVPDKLPIFLGYFETHKILPGVQQSLWIINYCREFFSIATPVLSLERLKFHGVIRPNSQLHINMQWNKIKNSVKVVCTSDGAVVSSGIIVFCDEGKDEKSGV